MSHSEVITIATDLLLTVIILALPAVVISLAVVLLISVLQTMTSIQEQTMTFAPRIIAVALGMIITMPWSLQTATAFTFRMVTRIAETAR